MKAIDHCFKKSVLLCFAPNLFSRKSEFRNKLKHFLFFSVLFVLVQILAVITFFKGYAHFETSD